MKKIKIFIVLAVMFGGQAAAQDTIHRNTPPGNYYCPYWIDTTASFQGGAVICTFEYAHEIGKQFYTRDSLIVYGVAACMIHFLFNATPCLPVPIWLSDTAEWMAQHYWRDPTWEHAEEALKLYQWDSDSLMVMLGDSLPVHVIDTPVSYYMQTDIFRTMYRGDSCYLAPLPIYERYFSNPQTVHDTFYVAFTQNGYIINKENQWVPSHIEVGVASFANNYIAPPAADNQHILLLYRPGSDTPTWTRGWSPRFVYFMFPILTPKPEEGDTVIVDVEGSIGNYVSVTPNPAEREARVLSSFGLTRIEAFDAGGRQVMGREASGVEATLDVTSWPRGTYLLRITTPLGTATKKLLVQ